MAMDKRDAEWDRVKNAEIHPWSQKTTQLDEPTVRRVRLLRAALWHVYPHSMEFWLEGIEREVAPEREVGWWEHVTACFLEFEQMMPAEESERATLFWVMTQLWSGMSPAELAPLQALPNREMIVEAMFAILRSKGPIVDMREK
jgi:hypothetical protein